MEVRTLSRTQGGGVRVLIPANFINAQVMIYACLEMNAKWVMKVVFVQYVKTGGSASDRTYAQNAVVLP
jgi:hypothetical protein